MPCNVKKYYADIFIHILMQIIKNMLFSLNLLNKRARHNTFNILFLTGLTKKRALKIRLKKRMHNYMINYYRWACQKAQKHCKVLRL